MSCREWRGRQGSTETEVLTEHTDKDTLLSDDYLHVPRLNIRTALRKSAHGSLCHTQTIKLKKRFIGKSSPSAHDPSPVRSLLLQRPIRLLDRRGSLWLLSEVPRRILGKTGHRSSSKLIGRSMNFRACSAGLINARQVPLPTPLQLHVPGPTEPITNLGGFALVLPQHCALLCPCLPYIYL